MPDIIKKLSIKGIADDTRNIGAEGQYIEISYDADGNIIEDITTPGVVVDHVNSLTKDLKGLAIKNHASDTDQYGPGTTDKYGHIKLGIGLERVENGSTQVKYGTSAGTAVQGNDSRMSNPRKNPNSVTFTDGTNQLEYDGSSAKTVTYSEVGAAKKNHASATTEYGVASKNNFGHVKISDGINVTGGVISLAPATEERIGGIIPDGSTVTIDPDGVLHGAAAGGSIIMIDTTETDLYGRDVIITSETGTDPVTVTLDEYGQAIVRGYTGTGVTRFECYPAGGGDPAVYESTFFYFGNYTATLSYWSAPVTIETTTPQMRGQVIVVKKDNLEVGRTTFDGTGKATFTAHNEGIYTFECTLGWKTFKSNNLPITEEIPYSIDLNGFVAVINISANESIFYGKTVVITADDSEIPTETIILTGNVGDSVVYYAYKPAMYTFTSTINE